MIAYCKHCNIEFQQRRSNHLYCKLGCKTMASYERNNYTYISGKYQKEQTVEESTKSLSLSNNFKLEKKVQALTKEIKQLSKRKKTGTIDSLKGTLVADTLNYGVKKMFAPLTLPATKGDIEEIKIQFEKLEGQNREIQLQNIKTQNQNARLLKYFDYLE